MLKAILFALAAAPVLFSADARPKVRAITAFIRIDAKNYESQVGDAVKFLKSAQAEYQASGYVVQTLRVVPQPLADYVKGMSHADAVAFVRKYGELAVKLGARPNLGALMLDADEDHFATDVAIDVFSTTCINGSLIVATESGIRWKSVREAARVIKSVAAKSPHGDGNFDFAAAAMVKPYTPFYPAAYHNGPGKMFAVGL